MSGHKAGDVSTGSSGRSGSRGRDIAILVFALFFPTALTYAYFVWGQTTVPGAAKFLYLAGKTIQFVFPVLVVSFDDGFGGFAVDDSNVDAGLGLAAADGLAAERVEAALLLAVSRCHADAGGYLGVALHDRGDSARYVTAAHRGVGERDEKIGDLRVAVMSLARCRNDDNAPRRIGEHYVYDLAELLSVSERRATKLANLHSCPPAAVMRAA